MLLCTWTYLQLWLSRKWGGKVCWTVWGRKVQESIFVGKALKICITWAPDLCGCSQCQGRRRGWWSWRAWTARGSSPTPAIQWVPFQTGWWISHFFLSKYQRYIALQSLGHLLHMAMKIRKYGDVLDGAPEMHVDPHNHDSGSKSFRICLNMFACTTW